jgi:hypothetical protein
MAPPIFEFCARPKSLNEGDSQFWLGLRQPAETRGNTYVIGREFKSLDGLKEVAAEVRADLERAIERAEKAFRK